MSVQNVISSCFFWTIVTLLQWSNITAFTGFPRTLLIPRFLPTPTNLTYQKGEVATIYCSVANLGTKTITWRKQPYHVPLFIGTQRFVRVDRFYLSHIPSRGQWNLLIKNVQTFDSGTYECQISSSQELRRNITINIVDKMANSSAYIEISGTRFVEKGGEINLLCNASGSRTLHGNIDWFKDGNMLLNRSKIGNKISISTHAIISTLTISKAVMEDTGTYVCRTTDLLTTRFRVDVLKADTKNVKRVSSVYVLNNKGEYGEFSDGSGRLSAAEIISPQGLLLLSCIIFNAFQPFIGLRNR